MLSLIKRKKKIILKKTLTFFQMKISKLIIISLLIIPLTGCFGGGEDDDTGEPATPPSEQISFYRVVDADEFVIQIPEDWETIQTFPTNYPENTFVAFRNNVQDHEFVANINVVRNPVEEGTQTEDYALQMYNTVSSQLVNFKELSTEEYELYANGEYVKTYLYNFEGSNDPTEKTRRFLQLSGVSGTNAYVITGSYDKNDNELAIDQVNQSIQTFYLP